METQIKQGINVNVIQEVNNYEGKVLQSKVIKTIPDFERFRAYYHKTDTVSVGLDYLASSDLVRVFFYNDDEWLGGYIINSSTSMRYFEVFSTNKKESILREKSLKEIDMVEISSIWILFGIRRNQELRLKVYKQSIIDAYNTQKPLIIGGSKEESIWKVFQIILSKEIYYGEIVLGEITIQNAKILYEEREKAITNFQNYEARLAKLSLLFAEREQSLSKS